MELVRLRVTTAFGQSRVGDIIERIPSVARALLAARWYERKLVELAEPESTQTESTPPAAKRRRQRTQK